jgi:hypothetical protein
VNSNSIGMVITIGDTRERSFTYHAMKEINITLEVISSTYPTVLEATLVSHVHYSSIKCHLFICDFRLESGLVKGCPCKRRLESYENAVGSRVSTMNVIFIFKYNLNLAKASISLPQST